MRVTSNASIDCKVSYRHTYLVVCISVLDTLLYWLWSDY